MALQMSRETPLLNEGYDLGLEQFNRTRKNHKKIKNDFLNLENPSVKYT